MARLMRMMNINAIEYGYPWWLSYGHLAILVPALFFLGLAKIRKWPRWVLAVAGAIAVWSLAALLAVQSFAVNGKPSLPTEHFLAGGTGKVLDIGAGTGRSTIMLLTSRPQATVVASDLFGDSFSHHFGEGGDPQQRLRMNLEAAGVAERATITTADMLRLPFANQSFDAIISAYAIDHVGRTGAAKALSEAHRVVKPGGEFLLMLVSNDKWTKFAYGPLLSHGGTRPASWWSTRAKEAGFEILEQGNQPATLFFLLRRPL